MSSSVAARLCRAHLLALGPDADPSALADVIWLGLQLALRGAAAPDVTISSEYPKSIEVARKPSSISLPDPRADTAAHPTANYDKSDSFVPVYPSYFTHPFGKIGASRINIPAGEALPQRLHLERALKPFKRRLLSHQKKEFDPIATAEASAEWRSIKPVYRATPERWFEVEILVESSDAMHVWDATLLELRRMLSLHGAFRRVRLWRYAMREGTLTISTPRGAVAAPRILVDPQGRRLCWFVTTGTSPLWRHAALADLVATLGRQGPTAIIQLMPYHTWPHTLLGDASEEVMAHAPGTPTARLLLHDPFSGGLERAPDALTVPITSLEPSRFEAWARFSMASRRMSHAAIRLKTAPLANFSVAAPLTEAPSPRQRIAAFRAIASSPAFQLLRLLSGMPLSLPVMRLMQMGMPERAQVHLAEILLSGLIERITPPDPNLLADLVEYDFVPGIREELVDSLTLSEGMRIDSSILQIAEQARCFVEAHAGKGKASFPVLVHNSMGDERLLEQAKSFLSVSKNFHLLPASEFLKPEMDGMAELISASNVKVRHEAAFNFLSEESITEHALHAGVVVPGASAPRCLLFFATNSQQTWLVASEHALMFILDDAETRGSASLVQHTSNWLDALPVEIKHDITADSMVRFGVSDMHGWHYSSSLFPHPRQLEDAIVAMVPGGRDGALMQLSGIALEYDEIRANVQPSLARTDAMHDIVDRISALPQLLEPDLTLATHSKSAGVQLVAIIALQHNFDQTHMGWLFDCISGDQAFLAFQAALALKRAAFTLSKYEQILMKDMAINTKHKLQVANLDDINVHYLLDEFITVPDTSGSSRNGVQTKRILIGSTGWELADYRAQAVNLLKNLGHEIVSEPVIESASELQSWLAQIEKCDMVLLLVGTSNEYGGDNRQSVPNRILLVEAEYQEAMRFHKPIMLFMLKDEYFSGGSKIAELDRMALFRQMLLNNHIVNMVDSPKQFSESLYFALFREHSIDTSQTVQQGLQSRNHKSEDVRHPYLIPLNDTIGSIPDEVDNVVVIDEAALVDTFCEFVKAGKVPDLQAEIELTLNNAVESAQWNIDAHSYYFWEPDDEYGQLLRWEFGPPSPDVFELSKYSDGVLYVVNTILVWIEVHCSFNFSVQDSIDKDMVHIGKTRANQKVKVQIEIEIGVRGVQEGFPEVESVEIASISSPVDFGEIEPDSFEDGPDD